MRIVRVMVKTGINKVRITGGEPLTRADLEQILAGISSIEGIVDVPMTTNAIGLAGRLESLCQAGLTRLNISLDSLVPEKYRRITGSDSLRDVLAGIETAVKMGIQVKINSVLIRGINDDEIDSLIDLSRDLPVSVRFIEMMPIGNYAAYNRRQVIFSDEILAARPDLIPVETGDGSVAMLFRKAGYRGTVGLISSISHQFCLSCNRLRLTSDGKLKPCLGRNMEIDMLPVVRNRSSSDEELEAIIREAIRCKPDRHTFSSGEHSARDMRAIGG